MSEALLHANSDPMLPVANGRYPVSESVPQRALLARVNYKSADGTKHIFFVA